MKPYITPDIICVEVEISPLMAASGPTLSCDLNNDAEDENEFAAPQYRSSLWAD